MKRNLHSGTVPAFLAIVLNVTPPGMMPALASDAFDAYPPLEPGQLEMLRGRSSFTNVQSIQDLDALVSGGSFAAHTMTSGSITIEQHALDSFEGVGIFNLFTGHNNAVNAAVGISVLLSE